eukprot:gene28786-32184_t
MRRARTARHTAAGWSVAARCDTERPSQTGTAIAPGGLSEMRRYPGRGAQEAIMHLLIFGLGYSARYSLDFLGPHIDAVAATTRSEEKAARMDARGIVPILFDGMEASPGVADALDVATHILISAAPDEDGDAVLRFHAADIARAAKAGNLRWIGYFSTVGVYGDTGGAW